MALRVPESMAWLLVLLCPQPGPLPAVPGPGRASALFATSRVKSTEFGVLLLAAGVCSRARRAASRPEGALWPGLLVRGAGDSVEGAACLWRDRGNWRVSLQTVCQALARGWALFQVPGTQQGTKPSPCPLKLAVH